MRTNANNLTAWKCATVRY